MYSRASVLGSYVMPVRAAGDRRRQVYVAVRMYSSEKADLLTSTMKAQTAAGAW